MFFRLIAIALWASICAIPAEAQTTEFEMYSEEEPDGTEFSPPEGINNPTTNWLVNNLARANTECQALARVYRFDCYRQKYKTEANRLEANSAYAVPRQVLRDVVNTLDTIIAENADPTVKPLRRGNKTYRAITPASTSQAAATYNEALDNAATVLLRSASDNSAHFDRIAEAVGSNKILLRSALFELCSGKLNFACGPDDAVFSLIV